MATSKTPSSQTPPAHSAPAAAPNTPRKGHQSDYYDTQFIVGRLKDDQRKSRLRFYTGVALLALVIVGLYTLTARRAEAPKSLETKPVVVPAPAPHKPPEPAKGKPAHKVPAK